MPDNKAMPDIKVFLTDPAHQQDRDFFFQLFDAYNAHKAEEAKKAADLAQPENAFDRFFGGSKKPV